MIMRIAIGMPRVGDVPAEVVSSHLKCGIQIAGRDDVEDVKLIDTLNVFPFDRVRELIVCKALLEECDYLLFIDADIILPLDTFDLLYKALVDKKAAAVSGDYHRRGHPYTSVWSFLKEAQNENDDSAVFAVNARRGIHQIHSSGLGCCLIDLEWVEGNLEKPYFRMGFGDDGEYKWEDSYFFSRIYQNGGTVYGQADVQCGHLMERAPVTQGNWQRLVQASTQTKVGQLDAHG